MAQLIVRRLDEGVKEKLKERAKRKGVSLEAEARAILEKATEDERPPKRSRGPKKGFGDKMHEIFKGVGLTQEERKQFDEGIRKLWSNNPPRFVDFKK